MHDTPVTAGTLARGPSITPHSMHMTRQNLFKG